jgi:hypothetical protein
MRLSTRWLDLSLAASLSFLGLARGAELPPPRVDFSYAFTTPHGLIEIAWRRSEKQMTTELTIPQGCEAVMTSPRMPNRAEPTDLRFDDRAVSLAPEPVALGTFLREARPAFRVGPSRHTMEIIY